MKIVPRIERLTGKPALFWVDSGNVEGYAWNCGHFECNRYYYQTQTKPCPPADATRLLAYWVALPGGDGEPVLLRKRLSYSRQ